MAKIFFFDLETTGVQWWQNGIHQIAGAIEIDGVVVEMFNFNVCPHAEAVISLDALAVGRVTPSAIAAYTPMAKVYAKVIAMLSKYVNKFDKRDKFHLAGYNNAGFDNPFFHQWFTLMGDPYFWSWFFSGPIDVIVLAAQKLIDVRHAMKNFKQATVALQLGIPVDETKLHDAEYDVSLLIQIYHKVTGTEYTTYDDYILYG